MVEKTLNPKIYHALLGVLIAAFVLLKLEALTLPFFWDEAWVYLPAIRTMAEQGPSIMPGSIDADLYTGHPLLFYFMASTWIKMWGYSLPIAHSFPLLISIGLIVSAVFIIRSNFKSSILMVSDKNQYLIRFRKDISFLNKPIIKEKLESLPPNSQVVIDIKKADFIDKDVIDEINDFLCHAHLKNISTTINLNQYNSNHLLINQTNK